MDYKDNYVRKCCRNFADYYELSSESVAVSYFSPEQVLPCSRHQHVPRLVQQPLSELTDKLRKQARKITGPRQAVLDVALAHHLVSKYTSLVAVDVPDLPGMPPAVDLVTAPLAYIRLHGRNSDTWWGSDAAARYADLAQRWAALGATIIGGMLFGLSRKASTEFSFFLAVPTLLAATGYELLSAGPVLLTLDPGPLLLGALVSFLSAYAATRILIRLVSRYSFEGFAWYRIAFGVAVLLTAQMG